MFVATVLQSVARPPRERALVLTFLTTSFALALLALAADAAPRWARVDRDRSAVRGPLEVSVRVENRSAPLYLLASRSDRWYLEARKGGHYEVRVHNTSGERLGLVLAVDGLNAINGLRSGLAAHEPMYILDPHESATIRGWRRNLRDVNRFVFVDEQRSYAERTGQANGDLGWIRVAAFREVQTWIEDDWYRPGIRDRSGPQSGAPGPQGEEAPQARRERATEPQAGRQGVAEPRAQAYDWRGEENGNPGTGWGRKEHDPVRRVDFSPEAFACAQVILRYEYRSGLVALGILPWRGDDRDRLWEREHGQFGFAQPPRW